MKKLLAFIMIFAIALTCCACSDSSNKSSTSSNEISKGPSTYVMSAEETILAEILVSGARILREPLSTTVKNVWTYKLATLCYYTFEIESMNGYGNKITSYYGGCAWTGALDAAALEKLDEEITYKCNDFLLTNQNSDKSEIGRLSIEPSAFKKDNIEAMQNGTPVDPDCIPVMQEYFVKNYK